MANYNHLMRLTEADLDQISWHDVHIHALRWQAPGDYDNELILDIDFILEWFCDEKSKSLSFAVAPATLTFHEVDKLHIDVALDYREPMWIYQILRDKSNWTIELQSFAKRANSISFKAKGFTQVVRAQPIVSDHQGLSSEEREELVKTRAVEIETISSSQSKEPKRIWKGGTQWFLRNPFSRTRAGK